jgi:RNA polymerase sigma-70 factor (ECF subfamily)
MRRGLRPETVPGVMSVVLDPELAAGHLPRLFGLAWSLCGSRHLAEELTQETYARVLSRPRRLRGGGSDFQYLARTLRNVVSDHWRAEQRRPPRADWDLVDEPAATGDPQAAAAAGEVYAAIGALPEHLRDVVAAVDVAGLTYAETAEALRIPNGTVMSRLFRARARLATALAA